MSHKSYEPTSELLSGQRLYLERFKPTISNELFAQSSGSAGAYLKQGSLAMKRHVLRLYLQQMGPE
jgi:hypothetical protein